MYKILSLLFFAYVLAITTEDIYDNSYALIIGIDKYKNVKPLNYAVKDAESIQDILVNTFNFPEGNITLLKNEEANKQAILKAFSDLTKKADDNDRVLIYFAGHGETLDLTEGGERGYLLPVEGNKKDLYLSSIGMDELEDLSEMIKAKHTLYLIDACYGGIAAVGSRGLGSSSTPNYIEKITRNRGVQIITAGSRGEQVIEKPKWGHSAFALNLKRGLKDGNADMDADGYITANELGLFLQKKVTIDSENQQTPQYGRMTSQEGEFVFIYSEQTIINQNYRGKSSDARLDLLQSEIEALKLGQSSSKDNNSHLLDDNILKYKGDNAKIKIDKSGIHIKEDGKSVDISLKGIQLEDEKGETVKISSQAILVGLIIGLIALAIILIIFGKFLSILIKSIFVIIGQILSRLLKIIIIQPMRQLLKKVRKTIK